MVEQKIEQLEDVSWPSKQGKHVRRIVRASGHTLRAEVYEDSYDFQSWAKVTRWDGSQWLDVYSIPYPLMATRHLKNGAAITAMRQDADLMINMALTIIGVVGESEVKNGK